MSSLAASRADGYYFPPEWKPEGGSLNRWNNSHGALGKRANKLHLGILVVRFELPYNSWCDGCGCHIAQGVRYNAEKKQVDKYLSSPIFEFSMTCRRCNHPFVIRTNPKEGRYDYVSGIRRKKEAFLGEADGTVEVEAHVVRDRAGRRVGEEGALERLERGALSEARAKHVREPVEELLEMASERRGKEGALRREAMTRARKRERAEDASPSPPKRTKGMRPLLRTAPAASDRELRSRSAPVETLLRRAPSTRRQQREEDKPVSIDVPSHPVSKDIPSHPVSKDVVDYASSSDSE
jgi:coiled-coil domain-containing protein 130